MLNLKLKDCYGLICKIYPAFKNREWGFLLLYEHVMKGDSVATANQIEYRLTQAKNKLVKLNKEATALKADIKKLETDFKKARMILIARAAEKRKAKKKPVAKKAAAKKKAVK